ncbi:hypothetical protein CEQ90_19635 [Lewinellaceae bacterium SD302]|nr:hypothetical protein CEQ90_19635 [Lewinellaceae bacterium SD302]
MSIVKLPVSGEEVYVEIWVYGDVNTALNRDEIDNGLKAAFNDPMNKEPFGNEDAFYAGQFFINELMTVFRHYQKKAGNCIGFQSCIARVKNLQGDWLYGWGQVALSEDEETYDEPGEYLIVACSPFADDIPPDREITEVALVGRKIAEKLG